VRHVDASTELAVEGLVLTLIAEAHRTAPRTGRTPPAWLRVAEDFIRDHAYGALRAADAAGAAGVHPVLLSRWFRRVHGVTVGEFVRRLRLERACALLVSSRKPLSEIALACGFADHAHFTRSFRRHMHIVPSEYRRAARR
jgi:AraC family transcriptional regulator